MVSKILFSAPGTLPWTGLASVSKHQSIISHHGMNLKNFIWGKYAFKLYICIKYQVHGIPKFSVFVTVCVYGTIDLIGISVCLSKSKFSLCCVKLKPPSGKQWSSYILNTRTNASWLGHILSTVHMLLYHSSDCPQSGSGEKGCSLLISSLAWESKATNFSQDTSWHNDRVCPEKLPSS